MDDRYYSDKNGNTRPEGKDKYTKADYFDENFSLEFKKGKGNAQSFDKKVSVDDDESFSSFVDSGDAEDIDGFFSKKTEAKPSQQRPSDPSRTPKGAPVSAGAARGTAVKTAGGARPAAANGQGGQRTPGAASRTPAGRPSGAPAGRPVSSAGKKAPQKKKGKSKAFIAIVSVLVVLIIAVGGFAAYMYSQVNKMIDNVNHDDTIVDDRYLPSDAPVSEEIVNILLIGSDERTNSKTVTGRRSDTMILLTIDSANSQLKLTSFLRDSYVSIPYTTESGEEKIIKNKMNAAYSKAGAQGVMDTIEYNFGVDVHDYVSVNFEAFEKIIDLLGGVTVDGVTEKEAKYMNKEAKTNIQAGSNHMNGFEALWYCRIRKLDSDFYRTQRQRKVLSAVIDQLKTMEMSEVLNILNEAFPYITTSLSQSEMKKLGINALSYVSYDVFQQQVPADKTWRDGNVNGSYVIDFDIALNKTIVQEFVYGKAEKAEE